MCIRDRVIVHTLLAFERAASISSIVVVCRPEDQAAVQCLADQHAIGKLCAVVAGGATRQRSVAAVSYTHLDVYKRQSVWRVWIEMPLRR